MSKLAMEVTRLVNEMRSTPKRHPAEGQGSGVRPDARTVRPAPAAKRRKPIRRGKAKQQKRDDDVAVITAVREEVFILDLKCICGRCRPSLKDAMHELEFRSQTRGQPPEDRFNVKNCIRLSARCHQKLHGEIGNGKTLRVHVLEPEKRAMGRLEVQEKIDGTWKTVAVYQRRLPKLGSGLMPCC